MIYTGESRGRGRSGGDSARDPACIFSVKRLATEGDNGVNEEVEKYRETGFPEFLGRCC